MVRRPRDEESAVKAARELLALCCADPDRIPPEIVDLHAELAGQRLEYPDVDSEMLTAAQSLLWVLADRKRYAAMLQDIDVPVLLLHGDQDRLINIASARAAAAANPHWQFEVAQGVGHVPQLEAPQWTIDAVLGWLAQHPDVADLASQAKTSVRQRGDRAAAQLARRRLPPARERPAADARRLAAAVRGTGTHLRRARRARPVLPRRAAPPPAAGAADAARPRPPGVGRRPPLPARLPPAAHRDPRPGWRRRSCATSSDGCSRTASTSTGRCGSSGSSRG